MSELAVLEALQVDPGHIAQISDEALEGEDKALARRIIRQFVAKIVIKEETGTLYYTFPFPDDLYVPQLPGDCLSGRSALDSRRANTHRTERELSLPRV